MRPDMHASAAAEAVRALNHATAVPGGAAGYEWPADVDAVLAELGVLAQRLPQALEQAARWLETNAAAGRVGHDKGHDGDHAAVLAAVLVRAGGAAAETMLRRLDEARQITSHLTGRATPQPLSTGRSGRGGSR
jgi:hypothetical protein